MSEIKTAEQYLCSRVMELEEENEQLKEKLDYATLSKGEWYATKWARKVYELGLEMLFKNVFRANGSGYELNDYYHNEPISFAEFCVKYASYEKLPDSMTRAEFERLFYERLQALYEKALREYEEDKC